MPGTGILELVELGIYFNKVKIKNAFWNLLIISWSAYSCLEYRFKDLGLQLGLEKN